MSKLTTAQMIEIIESKKIEECTPEQKAQVMAFAFGDDFMDSEDKGEKKTCQADQFESDLEKLHQDLIDQNIVEDFDQLDEIFDKLVLENRII